MKRAVVLALIMIGVLTVIWGVVDTGQAPVSHNVSYSFTVGTPKQNANADVNSVVTLEIGKSDVVTDAIAQAHAAIKAHDFKKSGQVVSDIMARYAAKRLRDEEFEYFIDGLVPENNPAFLTALNEWVTKYPRSADVHILRGSYYYKNAWYRRGEEYVQNTDSADLLAFNDLTGLGIKDFKIVESLGQSSPYVSLRLVGMYNMWSDSKDKVDEIFKAAIVKYPEYVALYNTQMHYLSAKWRGSDRKQREFVEHYAGKASRRSPLKFLYLYYFNGKIEERLEENNNIISDAWLNAFMKDEHVVDRMNTVFDLSKTMDKYEFNQLWAMIGNQYVSMYLADAYIDRSYKIAYERLGDTNYELDRLYANYRYTRVYHYSKNQDEDIKEIIALYKKAIAHAENFTFPDDETRIKKLGSMYATLAVIAQQGNNPAVMEEYARLALKTHAPQKDAAIKLCSLAQKKNENYTADAYCSYALETWPFDGPYQGYAHYWRAMAYQVIKPDKVIDELTQAILYTDKHLTPPAVMTLATMLYEKGEYEKANAVIHQRPEIFTHENKQVAAAAYANMCGIYIKLNDDTAALDSCNKSLDLYPIQVAQIMKDQITARTGAR